jgi:hypothetical protein
MTPSRRADHRATVEPWERRNRLGAWAGTAPIWLLDLLILVASFIFFLQQPFGGFETIVGDNIAQVGYWRAIFHRHLVGGLGSSAIKPGLVIGLGLTYDASVALFGTPDTLLPAVIALFAALLVTVVARIASEGGGFLAGPAAAGYLVGRTPLREMAASGSSTLFFLPLLLAGVWLFSHKRWTAGTLLICTAALVRIEGIFVLAWLLISEQLLGRRWKGAVLSALCIPATLACVWLLSFAVQGDVRRLDAGFRGTGYYFPDVWPTVTLRLSRAMIFVSKTCGVLAIRSCAFPFLALPAVVGFMTCVTRRTYFSVCAIIIFLVTYATIGIGPLRSRFFDFVIPLTAAFGAAGLFYAYRWSRDRLGHFTRRERIVLGMLIAMIALLSILSPTNTVVSAATLALFVLAGLLQGRLLPEQLRSSSIPSVVLGVAVVLASLVHMDSALASGSSSYAPYTLDAHDFLASRPVPRGASILIDDDVIYGITIREPNYLRKVRSLQYFNVQDAAGRKSLLQETNYIVVSKRDFPYYYLLYDPLGAGDSDPFRHVVRRLLDGATILPAYGRNLAVTENSPTRLVIRVL